MNLGMDEALTVYVVAIKKTEEYREYQRMLSEIKAVPGLKEKLDAYRRENFVLQNGDDASLDAIERFEKKYERFRMEPLVEEFLAAELAFCRMMQYNNSLVIQALRFE